MVTSDFPFYIPDLLLFSAWLVPNMAASTLEAQRLLDEAKARRDRARQRGEKPQKVPQAVAAAGEGWHSWESGTIGANAANIHILNCNLSSRLHQKNAYYPCMII